MEAASAFGDGIGYALGGAQNSHTTDGPPYVNEKGAGTDVYTPFGGMVTYNMSTGSWSNITSAKFTQTGSFLDGRLEYLPGYGATGLLVPLGGLTSAAGDVTVGFTTIDDFKILSLYDIASGTWHTQTTSGESPPGRCSFCSVGVQGDNGTFEVFALNIHVIRCRRFDRSSYTEVHTVHTLPQKETLSSTQSTFFHSLPSAGKNRPTHLHKLGVPILVMSLVIEADRWP